MLTAYGQGLQKTETIPCTCNPNNNELLACLRPTANVRIANAINQTLLNRKVTVDAEPGRSCHEATVPWVGGWAAVAGIWWSVCSASPDGFSIVTASFGFRALLWRLPAPATRWRRRCYDKQTISFSSSSLPLPPSGFEPPFGIITIVVSCMLLL